MTEEQILTLASKYLELHPIHGDVSVWDEWCGKQEDLLKFALVALNLFKENSYTKEFLIESVRRCLNAIDNGAPHRLTEEFDDLILLDDW
jgi:hypothetical protein